MIFVRCTNPCHDAPTDDGVDVRDVIEAAVAQGCSCLDLHCPALLDQPPEPFLGDCSTAYADEPINDKPRLPGDGPE